jgi:hypothetical protein
VVRLVLKAHCAERSSNGVPVRINLPIQRPVLLPGMPANPPE